MQTYTVGLTHKITPDQKMEKPTHEGCCRLRVVATVPCFIKITKNGDAASEDDFPLVARLPEYLTISQGGVKAAVYFDPKIIGEVFVTEIS